MDSQSKPIAVAKRYAVKGVVGKSKKIEIVTGISGVFEGRVKHGSARRLQASSTKVRR